jgi:hypothetical protein
MMQQKAQENRERAGKTKTPTAANLAHRPRDGRPWWQS